MRGLSLLLGQGLLTAGAPPAAGHGLEAAGLAVVVHGLSYSLA